MTVTCWQNMAARVHPARNYLSNLVKMSSDMLGLRCSPSILQHRLQCKLQLTDRSISDFNLQSRRWHLIKHLDLCERFHELFRAMNDGCDQDGL